VVRGEDRQRAFPMWPRVYRFWESYIALTAPACSENRAR
jgi:hypothetical protein